MKTQAYILNVLFVLLFFSCKQNSFEKKINGKWYEIENEHIAWCFYPDSLVFHDEGNTNVKWKATESAIEFGYPTMYWDSLGKKIVNIDHILINYQLSDGNDRLFGTLKNKYGTHKFGLLKANNYIEYLNRKYKIGFTLPKLNSAKQIKVDPIYGLKVFIGFSNNEIKARTEISESLNHLQSDVMEFKNNIEPYKLNHIETHKESLDYRFHFRVFADKNISDSEIAKQLAVIIKGDKSLRNQNLPEQFREIVSDTLSIRIFRVYQSNEELTPFNIAGVEIESIAENVYE